MKKNITDYLVILAVTCSACNDTAPVAALAPVKKEIEVVVSDSTKVQINITGFLRWYKDNYKKANSFPLLIKDKADNFMVNKTAYTDYLAFLNSSNYLSPKYIGYWETFFIDKEKELNKNKIKSDIPDGFDFDLVLITQEPDILLNKIDSIKFNITSMNDSVALVGMRLPSDSSIEYEFEMYKTKNTWQIGYISTPNYD
ncbi:MAG: hypothetical protein ABIQ31_03690 [Ferruginibacter sp.]